MISYNDALKTIIETVYPGDIEEKVTFNCAGQVISEDILSTVDLPLRDSSIPDGYAVRSEDIRQASAKKPVTLSVVESVRAGNLARNKVKPGIAIRIMTGCVLPAGADCVIPFEDTDESRNKECSKIRLPSNVKIFVPGTTGLNVRRVGSHTSKGSLLIHEGTVIGPNHISVLMSIGKNTVKVIRRPTVAIISTGDELINPGYPLTPGKAYNSNTAAIASMVSYYGGIPQILGVAHDYETSIAAKIRKGLSCDIIITSGGVSNGDYDLIQVFMEKYGELKISRINMLPGASFSFGIVTKMSKLKSENHVPLLALAGPPPSCLINFETLVRPALLKMKGVAALEHPAVKAVADDSIPEKSPTALVKWTNLRVKNDEYHVKLKEFDKKGLLDAMAQANSLVVIPENTAIDKGGKVKVWVMDWSQGINSDFT